MIRMVKVIALKPMDGHLLWVKFSDDSEGVRDFDDVIAEGGPMVEPLRDPDFSPKRLFRSVPQAGQTASMSMRSIFTWKWKRPAY